ncbi:MAG TPA: ABC transporter permease subunit [Candidatus Bathyarchaeota archaeon]|nr:ABC transporter permease subunit [Candidatus Bathyarchaeota archaeon]
MTTEIVDGIIKAFQLIFSLDPEVYRITGLSLYVSGLAVAMATLWSLPLAAILGLKNFRGRRFVRGTFNAFIGFPTVVLGLILYLFFSRSGPLGMFGLLYTPLMISIGQSILITPILVSFITSAVESIDKDIRDLAKTLGSSEISASIAVLKEASGGVTLAVLAAFNRAFAELGIAMMVGGNIYGRTRILTTAIALESNKAAIEVSLALGVILVGIVYILNITINYLRRR